MSERRQSKWAAFAPQAWPIWLGVALLWLIVQLPYGWQCRIGKALGDGLRLVAPRRRHIAEINLRLCFPDLSVSERARLLREHFRALGMGLIELGMCWWLSDARLARMTRIEGLEHLHAALAHGNGAIFLGGHYTTLDFSGRILNLAGMPFKVTYRRHENPLIDRLIARGRARYAAGAIPRDNMRDMLRSLRHNEVVWIATDQNFRHKHSVFAPFFGVPAATSTAVPRIARMTGAAVVPVSSRRLPGRQGYLLVIHPPLAHFPTDDIVADVTRLNQALECEVRKAPEQYWWIHRRFKTRPPGQADVYGL